MAHLPLMQDVYSIIASIAGTVLYIFSKTHIYTLGWIAGGIDVVGGLFYIATIYYLAVYLETRKHLGILGVVFAAALLSKESAMILLPISLIYIWLYSPQPVIKNNKDVLVLLSGISFLFVINWFAILNSNGVMANSFGFDFNRMIYIFSSSFWAILPALSSGFKIGLFIAGLALGGSIFLKGNPKTKQKLILASALWFLPGLVFLFTIRPENLQPYYAQYNIIGLAVFMAIMIEQILIGVHHFNLDGHNQGSGLKFVTLGISALVIIFIGAYAVISGQNIQKLIRENASPALFEAQYSQKVYAQLNKILPKKFYEEIIFLNMSDLMWWSTGKGRMIPVMFSKTTVKVDGYFGYEVPDGMAHTTDSVLVLNQVSDSEFEIVE